MNYRVLMEILQSNFFLNFFTTYGSTFVLDNTFDYLKNRRSKGSISEQLFACMQSSLFATCDKLGWEYNPTAFWDICLSLSQKGTIIYTEETLIRVFSEALGHQIKDIDIACWEHFFHEQLSSKDCEQLREFIKLQFLFEKTKIPSLQKRYIKRFYQPQVSVADQSLTLNDLYFPNEYRIGNQTQSYNDLLDLIFNFKNGTIKSWLKNKGITYDVKNNVLFILGLQCTGKSTLISKIIIEYYRNGNVQDMPLHVVSFSNNSFRTKRLCIKSICDYLSIGEEQLSNSLLLIDGLDESDSSVSGALIDLEELVYDLQELECRAIITSRPILHLSNGQMSSLNICLQPFSSDQAIEWLKIYKTLFEDYDISVVQKQINSLSTEIKQVILIPYIFRSCIIHNIAINQITELGKLYDLIFHGRKAEFSKTPYNFKPRILEQSWEYFQCIITNMSIEYMNSSDNTISIDKFKNDDWEDQLINKISSEFFLFSCDSNRYSFVHDSIPYYFIARDIFNSFVSDYTEDTVNKIATRLDVIIGDNSFLPIAVADFIEYFVRSNHISNIDLPINFLKAFLNHQFSSEFTITADLEKIQKYYYQRFIGIIRVVLAFIVPNTNGFSQYDLFRMLTENEKEQLVKYSNLGQAPLDCLKICTFSNNILNGINLNGSNFSGKSMSFTTMKYATLKDTILSGIYLSNSDLTLSTFDNAFCSIADFSNSILFGCSFRNACLNGADFSNANLSYADFRGAKISKTKFNGANMTGIKISFEQVRNIFDFDIEFIKKNKIEVYMNDCLISNALLEEEFKRQYPVAYVFYNCRKNK